MDATLAPFRENSARIVVERINSGPDVVGTVEAWNNAFRDRVESCLHKASDIRYGPIIKRPIDVSRIAAVIANDHDRSVRPAISHAVKTNLRGGRRRHSGYPCALASRRF